jgi:hypothetical protein
LRSSTNHIQETGFWRLPKTLLPLAPEIPLAIALLMVGLFPKYKQFGEIEAPLRRFSHSLIGVPKGLEKVSAEMAATPILDVSGDRASVMKMFLGHRLPNMPPWARNKLATDLQLNELATSESDVDDDGEANEESKEQFWRLLQSQLRGSIQVAQKWYRAKVLVHKIFEQPGPQKKGNDAEAQGKYSALRTS